MQSQMRHCGLEQHVTRFAAMTKAVWHVCVCVHLYLNLCMCLCVRVCWFQGVWVRGDSRCKARELDGIWITWDAKSMTHAGHEQPQCLAHRLIDLSCYNSKYCAGPEHWLSCREICILWQRLHLPSTSTSCCYQTWYTLQLLDAFCVWPG